MFKILVIAFWPHPLKKEKVYLLLVLMTAGNADLIAAGAHLPQGLFDSI